MGEARYGEECLVCLCPGVGWGGGGVNTGGETAVLNPEMQNLREVVGS